MPRSKILMRACDGIIAQLSLSFVLDVYCLWISSKDVRSSGFKSKEWTKAKSSRTPSRSKGATAQEADLNEGANGRSLSLLFYAIKKYLEL
eukprot:119446-Hanusia_phi.AAC.1